MDWNLILGIQAPKTLFMDSGLKILVSKFLGYWELESWDQGFWNTRIQAPRIQDPVHKSKIYQQLFQQSKKISLKFSCSPLCGCMMFPSYGEQVLLAAPSQGINQLWDGRLLPGDLGWIATKWGPNESYGIFFLQFLATHGNLWQLLATVAWGPGWIATKWGSKVISVKTWPHGDQENWTSRCHPFDPWCQPICNKTSEPWSLNSQRILSWQPEKPPRLQQSVQLF